MTKLIPRMYFHNMLVYVYCSKKVKLSSKGTSKAVFFTMNIYLVLDDVLLTVHMSVILILNVFSELPSAVL